MRRSNGYVTRVGALLPLLIALLLVRPGPAGAQDKQTKQPTGSGLVETTKVSLMLLDVEVVDKKGRPIPGLTAEDFYVQLNYKNWPIYSLDDLCPQPADDTPAEPAPDSELTELERTIASLPAAGPSGTRPPVDELRFALYFDFSRLAMDGRDRAAVEAKRWVRETMQDGEEAMIAAYASLTGLETLIPFTRDKEALIATIDEAYASVEMRDTYATELIRRVEQCCVPCNDPRAPPECCDRCCSTGNAFCKSWAWEEYKLGKSSLNALRRFLTKLGTVDGRKSVIWFHQTTNSVPRHVIGIDTMDHLELMAEVGAEATTARASLHTAFTGNEQVEMAWMIDQAVNLGANLADYTGGSYNRRINDLGRVIDSAGRGVKCVYRIGLEPPDSQKGGVYQLAISAQDRLLPFRYRVQHLTENDKWWRGALDVLDDPDDSQDVKVVAALLPVRAVDGNWDVKVQVALELESLALIPSGNRQKGEWEVGALLVRGRGYGKKWEMLGKTTLLRIGEGDTEAVVLHERELTGLPPGDYELRAFARDRWSELYGGSSSSLTLPEPGKLTLAGPLIMRADGRHVVSTLPLRTKKDVQPTRSSDVQLGRLPVNPGAILAGERLEFVTWVCPGADSSLAEGAWRYVALGEEPIFRMDEPQRVAAGECIAVTDRLETAAMETDDYSFNVFLNRGDDAAPAVASQAFRVVPPERPQPGTELSADRE